MALDKFINSVRSEVAKKFSLTTDAEIDAFFIGMEESARDNQEALEKRDKMLRDTVAELCEAKRLLKAVVEDMNSNDFCRKFDSCKVCAERYSISCEKKFKWRCTDEVKKLIKS